VTFTFDLEHLWHIWCYVLKPFTKCEQNGTIRYKLIADLPSLCPRFLWFLKNTDMPIYTNSEGAA